MKNLFRLLFLLFVLCTAAHGQKISTIDFVQIVNDNKEEAVFYYENNWLILRKMAIEKGYIDSFELMETEATADAPFHLILKTTYPDKAAFDKAEERFQALIKEKGERRLLNDKQPGDFRKILFSKLDAKHLY